jgi:hypothetical protein
MAKWTHYYIGQRITLQDWRHITITISKRYTRQKSIAKANFEDINDNSTEQYETPDDLAASYTGQIVANYSITINILKRLTADSLEVFEQVSHRWHIFLKLTQ